MSAKPAKKNPKSAPAAAPVAPASLAPAVAGAAATAPSDVSWTESSDPRKRLLGQLLIAGIWIYVAALWLLALDQTFDWGIFGPKVPPPV